MAEPTRSSRPRRHFPTLAPALPRALAVVLLLGGLAGCVGAAVGAGATVGVAALDDRGVQGVARDAGLATRVRGKWLNYDLETGDTLAVDGSVKVYNRRAMLTGTVKTEDIRAKAVRLTWEVEGIEEVINELAVGDTTISDSAVDSWISTQLTTKLTFDKDVQAINYIIETENGVVYLLGAAQSQAELDRALGHARSISRVREVISHVRIKTPEAPAPGQPKQGG
jgi:osmotically-inducible protein OsmY